MNVNEYICCSFFLDVRLQSFSVLFSFCSEIRRKIDLEQSMAGISMISYFISSMCKRSTKHWSTMWYLIIMWWVCGKEIMDQLSNHTNTRAHAIEYRHTYLKSLCVCISEAIDVYTLIHTHFPMKSRARLHVYRCVLTHMKSQWRKARETPYIFAYDNQRTDGINKWVKFRQRYYYCSCVWSLVAQR